MKSKLLLTLALWSATLAAAEPATERISVRLKFMAWDDALLGCGIRTSGKVVPVGILLDYLSNEIVYEGPARLEIVRITANEPPQDAPTKKGAAKPAKQAVKPAPANEPPVAWVNLPASANGQRLILAVAPGKWEGGIMAIPDSPGSFPPGSLRFFNLCPYPLEVRIGQNSVKIPQKEARSIRGGAKNLDYFDGTIMTYENGEEKVGYSLHMFQDNSQRSLFFVAAGPEGLGTVILKGVGDLSGAKMPALKRTPPPLRK